MLIYLEVTFLRTVFDILDGEKIGTVSGAEVLRFMSGSNAKDLPTHILDTLSEHPDEKMTFGQFVNLVTDRGILSLTHDPRGKRTSMGVFKTEVQNSTPENSAPGTPDVLRPESSPALSRAERTGSLGRNRNSSVLDQCNYVLSPMLVTAGMSMLATETASLNFKLDAAQIEIQFQKSKIQEMGEALVQTSIEADERIYQEQEKFKNSKVC